MKEQQTKVAGKTAAIIAYFTIFGSIIAIFLNLEDKHKFAQYHTRQGMLLHLMLLLVGSLTFGFQNFYIDLGMYIAYLVLWFYGFLGAISGTYNEIPLVGPFAQKFLNKII